MTVDRSSSSAEPFSEPQDTAGPRSRAASRAYRRLTSADLDLIAERSVAGDSSRAIAADLGCDPTAVQRARKREPVLGALSVARHRAKAAERQRRHRHPERVPVLETPDPSYAYFAMRSPDRMHDGGEVFALENGDLGMSFVSFAMRCAARVPGAIRYLRKDDADLALIAEQAGWCLRQFLRDGKAIRGPENGWWHAWPSDSLPQSERGSAVPRGWTTGNEGPLIAWLVGLDPVELAELAHVAVYDVDVAISQHGQDPAEAYPRRDGRLRTIRNSDQWGRSVVGRLTTEDADFGRVIFWR